MLKAPLRDKPKEPTEVIINMAVKVVFWSCLVTFLGYFAYQELSVVTVSFSLQMSIPAKPSDVFQVLVNPEYVLKIHPLCVGVSNVIRSQETDGTKTVQYTMQEKVPLVEFLEISKVITFQVNLTVEQENAVIQNRVDVLGGVLKIRQRWTLADLGNSNRDETLLENYFEITGHQVLATFSTRKATKAHSTMLKNIRKCFMEACQKPTKDKNE